MPCSIKLSFFGICLCDSQFTIHKAKGIEKYCVPKRLQCYFLLPFLWVAIFFQVAKSRWQGSACRIKRTFVMSRHALGLSSDATKGPPTPLGTIIVPSIILIAFFSVWFHTGNLCDLKSIPSSLQTCFTFVLGWNVVTIRITRKIIIAAFEIFANLPNISITFYNPLQANCKRICSWLPGKIKAKEDFFYNLVMFCSPSFPSCVIVLFEDNITFNEKFHEAKTFGAKHSTQTQPEWNVQLIFYGSLFY